ncbi:MAG: hypothetical protein HKL80_10380 [Acidimicrobiales bacterium]|nr:hypothetical protein [Acidimicrobiales bacterium]
MFSHGYLLKFAHYSSGDPNIFLCDSAGQPLKELLITPPNTASVFLTSVDVGKNSQLGFAGKTKGAGGKPYAFIGLSGIDGVKPIFFNTGKYIATKIAVADDGSIWAVGATGPDNSTVSGQSVTKWNNYDTVRHYSSSGILMEHYLPRWESSIAYSSVTTDSAGQKTSGLYDSGGSLKQITIDGQLSGYSGAWNAKRQVFLRSSGSQIILLDGENQLVYRWNPKERNFVGQPIVGYFVKTLPIITGVVLHRNGDVVASLRCSDSISGSLRGLFRLVQESSGTSLEWQEVHGTLNKGHALGKFDSLLGADGDSLVYSRTKDKGDKSTAFYESNW